MLNEFKNWLLNRNYKPSTALDYQGKSDIKKVLTKSVKPEEISEKITEIVNKIGDQNKSSLAEYVAKRKGILDLLESKLGYEDLENETRYKEEAVHQIICPMTIDSTDISIDNYHKNNINSL